MQPAGIAGDVADSRIKRDLDLNFFGRRGGLKRIDRGIDDRGSINGPNVELQFAGDKARNIQKIFDQLGLRFSIAIDGLDSPAA